MGHGVGVWDTRVGHLLLENLLDTQGNRKGVHGITGAPAGDLPAVTTDKRLLAGIS